jgi:hypothetical protein
MRRRRKRQRKSQGSLVFPARRPSLAASRASSLYCWKSLRLSTTTPRSLPSSCRRLTWRAAFPLPVCLALRSSGTMLIEVQPPSSPSTRAPRWRSPSFAPTRPLATSTSKALSTSLSRSTRKAPCQATCTTWSPASGWISRDPSQSISGHQTSSKDTPSIPAQITYEMFADSTLQFLVSTLL